MNNRKPFSKREKLLIIATMTYILLAFGLCMIIGFQENQHNKEKMAVMELFKMQTDFIDTCVDMNNMTIEELQSEVIDRKFKEIKDGIQKEG